MSAFWTALLVATIVWIVLAGVYELTALVNREPGTTISEHVHRAFFRHWWTASPVLLLVGWLVGHFGSGGVVCS